MKAGNIKALVTYLVVALLLVQCQSRDQDAKQSGQPFNATLHSPFKKAPSEVGVRFRNNQQLQKTVNEMVLRAVRAGDLKIYQTDSLQKRLSPDSLDKSAIKYHYFKFFTNWKLRSADEYGSLNVRAMAYPSGQSQQLMYMKPKAVHQLLDSAQKALIRQAYYSSVIERPFLNQKARTLVPAFQIGDRQTVRLVQCDLENPVFGSYVAKQISPISKKLFDKVKADEVPIYQSALLDQELSDTQRQHLIQNDSIKTKYRPKPTKKPRYVRDTLLQKPLKYHRINSYIVLEKWQPAEGQLLDYQPSIKAIGPIVEYPSGPRILYWIKAEDLQQSLKESQHRWLYTYLLHTLQAEFYIGK